MERSRSFRCLIALVGVTCLFSSAEAANRFRIESQEAPAGSTGNEVLVLMESDQDILGFSVYFEYDQTKITIQSVELGSDALGVNPSWTENPDDTWAGAVFLPQIDNSLGRLRCGVVFDFAPEEGSTVAMSSGAGQEILVVTYDVQPAVAPGPVALDLMNVTTQQPVRKNVMTDLSGATIDPLLTDGTITIPDLRPQIQSLTPAQGPPGTQLFIGGQNFDQPGLSVRICDKAVAFELLPDNETLDVVAPDCVEGPADVEVCNDFGCDTDSFTYPEAPGAPEIQTILPDSGVAGDTFLISGQGFDQPGLRVNVCGTLADSTLLPDNQTIDVEAPLCEQDGWATVEVCTDLGCDAARREDQEGFFYEAVAPVLDFVTPSEGRAGLVILISGKYFDQPGLTVTMCGEEAFVDLLNDGAMNVTTPPCGSTGPVDIEVCTDLGCTLLSDGFTYEGGNRFIRGDSNASGIVDLSDGIYTLNWLFVGGPAPICMDTADADDSGGTRPELTDAIYTFNFLFTGGETPPAPGPRNCGLDLTEDAMDCAVVPPPCR